MGLVEKCHVGRTKERGTGKKKKSHDLGGNSFIKMRLFSSFTS